MVFCFLFFPARKLRTVIRAIVIAGTLIIVVVVVSNGKDPLCPGRGTRGVGRSATQQQFFFFSRPRTFYTLVLSGTRAAYEISPRTDLHRRRRRRRRTAGPLSKRNSLMNDARRKKPIDRRIEIRYRPRRTSRHRGAARVQ